MALPVLAECRAMNVVVCVKQIPDPADPGALDPRPHPQARRASSSSTSPTRYGVEMALQLVDKAGGGEVTLVSMAPNSEVERPAHRARHGRGQGHPRQRRRAQGRRRADTAKVLAAAIKRVEGADLVLAATESTDGYTGTVPEQIAELLDLPSLTFAKHIEVADGTVKVQRQTEAGYDEVEARCPPWSSVTAGVVEPRYPSFKGIMAAKTKPVDEVTVADLGLDAAQRRLGRRRPGDHRRRRRAASARPARSSRTTATAYEKIVEFLDGLKVI